MTTTSAQSLASINPATGEVVGTVSVTPASEITRIVARARAAQAGWAATSLEARGAMLVRGGERLTENCEALGLLLTREMGKPLSHGIGEVASCGRGMASTVEDIARALAPTPCEDDRTRSTIYHDPLGVCAAISPWNFPISMPHWLVVPALMAGNTVVLKPSEETPLIAQEYVDALNAFLPEGVLQIVHGADEQGKALVAADVDLIAFTGSRETGKRILSAAAPALKRVILELGGKDPMIVLDDADLDRAATFAAMNSFRNAGQVCVSTERIYVHEHVADDFVEKLVRAAGELEVGDGTEPDVVIGPMINARQRDHVLTQVADAVRAGARVVHGGGETRGNVVTPIVLVDTTHEMAIMRDETFGPVACVTRVGSDDEAVALANDSPFGLGACVFGGDETRARAIARRLTAGMIGINKGCGGAAGTPWVGARQSGYGYHSSPEGHRQFTQARVVSVSRPEGA